MPRPEAIYRPLRRILSKRLSLIQYREEGAQQTLRELRLLRESMRGMSLVERERVISRLKSPGAFRKYVFDGRGLRGRGGGGGAILTAILTSTHRLSCVSRRLLLPASLQATWTLVSSAR
jgi:hypothetical protein